MIVTSKRCFLNVLTQLWPAERLLNANYYIGDKRAVNGYTKVNDSLSFDEFGQLIKNNSMTEVPQSFGGCYHIHYSKCLDPEPFRVDQKLIVGNGSDSVISSEERFINNHLNNPDVFLEVYQFLFKHQLEGNGIQILIMEDDSNLCQFGHIICQYLSINFGVDIIFLDPKFRNKCRGFEYYNGNKELGAKTVKDIRDYELMYNFHQAVSQTSATGSISNLSTYLSCFDFNELMYMYNLLYPNDPIPPGNYTADHIREILIARATVNLKNDYVFSNLILNDWSSLINRMNAEDADFGQDGGLW